MNLTALKYVVTLAQERHFGRAAQACAVSQPTLSIAVKKLEEELQVQLFERTTSAVSTTPVGEEIVRQAQAVLAQAETLREIARRSTDVLAGPMRLGMAPSIRPGLQAVLAQRLRADAPQLTLQVHEEPADALLELVRAGGLDAALVSEHAADRTLRTRLLYEEPCLLAVPSAHPLAQQQLVRLQDLRGQTLLLPEPGDCFREHVLRMCPELARRARQGEAVFHSIKGASLQTLAHMVAAGMGLAVLPSLSTGALKSGMDPQDLRYLPFEPQAPARRVVLAWRRSYIRQPVLQTLQHSLRRCELPGLHWLLLDPEV
jgi:LysR family hydrogen peroxide-inducible transcriptional activator